MGSCCGSGEQARSEEGAKESKFESGGANDLSNGPAANRGCTDAWCIIVFAVSWVLFVIVSIAGISGGNLGKLYKPRDFSGAYCDVAENWNNGPNLEGFPKQSYMMNVSSTVDEVAKQMLCSSSVASVARFSGVLTLAELNVYLATCCLVPNEECDASLSVGGDLSSASGLASGISGRMGELTNMADASSLASPSGLNGDMFTNMWADATKYFTAVCVKACDTDYTSIANRTDLRSYTYEPAADNPLATAWSKIGNATDTGMSTTQQATLTAVKAQMTGSFTFQALPLSMCNYADKERCVPMPGVVFKELVAGTGYCTFEMAAEAAGAVGASAASAMSSMGLDSFSSAGADGIGEMMGDVMSTVDTIIVVAVLAFALGLVFLVVLRFTVGICVWIAVLLTCLMFPFAGALSFTRSGQCQGAGLFDTGVQVGVAVAVAGTTAVTNAVSGVARSEAMNGNGADYNGIQKVSRSGKSCKQWSVTIYNGATFNGFTGSSSLEANYCRNPYNMTDVNKARTIWCFTTDPEVDWELCSPIGVLLPPCDHGYAVEGEQMRDMLKILAYVLLALSIVWFIIIGCFVSRIRLAIALNKVAAEFLAQNPMVLMIPIVQSIVGIAWIIIWCILASFIISQVPDGVVSTSAYSSYLEAYGIDGSGWTDSGTPGACTDSWPTGGVYKSVDCNTALDGIVSCWRCFPPRYAISYQIAYSLFCFLWNNAFNIALGQIVTAMAVSTWFFAAEKGVDPVVIPAFKTVCRYHLGSVAFGSFIIALVQFIRAVMKYLEKQAAAQKNKIMVMVFQVIGCCIWCFEKCMQFLNKNAYIQIALMGTNFCTSAKKAFFLILRNALRFGAVAVLGQVVHYIGVFCITIGTIFLGYLIVRAMHEDINPLTPMFVFAAIGYVVSELFMSVFGMATDTSLQCFIACEEMGGHPNVPSILASALPEAMEKKPEAEGEYA